jgi:allophanate hydrolase
MKALVAERYAAVRGFFDANEAQVIEPVRAIIAGGRKYDAADLFEAQTRLRAIGQRAAPMWDGIDVLLVPTAPTQYTIAAMRDDPVALNRNLGAYTSFVNLLDYAAISVPSARRAREDPEGDPAQARRPGLAAAAGPHRDQPGRGSQDHAAPGPPGAAGERQVGAGPA